MVTSKTSLLFEDEFSNSSVGAVQQQHLLIIEDSATFRHSLNKVFVANQCRCTLISNYREGLDELNALIAGKRDYSGLVMGWPEHTDVAADEILVSLHHFKLEKLPVLLLSERADPAEVDWITQRRGVALLPWSHYAECTEAMTQLTASVKQQHTEQPDIDLENVIRILLVDDSPTFRHGYRNFLTQHGYVVETASSVEEALELGQKSMFDIAIIDYFLPNDNGDVLVRSFKQNPMTRSMVISVVTGTYSDHVIKRCLDAGAVECMFKNEAKELFLARVRSMTRAILDRRSIDSERRRLERILASVGEGVYGVDQSGRIQFINPAAKKILGYRESFNFIGQSAHTVFHYAQNDGNHTAENDCYLSHCYRYGEHVDNWQTVFWHESGRSVPVECTVYPMQGEGDGNETGSVVAFRDISDRKLLEEELHWQATHDPLTRLLNRSHFKEKIQRELTELKSSHKHSALLVVDIDRFKFINDTAGLVAGDHLLVRVGERLQSHLRPSDILGRIGGDEYAIIVRNINPDNDEIFAIAESFRKLLSENKFQYAGRSYDITATIGVAVLDQFTKSLVDVMTNADIACYIAKRKGRNQTHIFAGDHESKMVMNRELGWSSRLREAIKNDRFVLNFQPIMPLNKVNFDNMPEQEGRLWAEYQGTSGEDGLHYEALLRLEDQDSDLVVPNVFLPTAERFDIMQDIDHWVINKALQTLSEHCQRKPKTTMSINLSAQTLGASDTADYIKDRLAAYQVNPHQVIFEITETQALTNVEATRNLIAELRTLGCQFALDDFGSGFSSFSHLKYFDVDIIKIDGLFAKGLAANQVDQSVILGVSEIARALNKRTVVEYVNSPEVLQALRASNVDYIQGYYVSKPLPSMIAE